MGRLESNGWDATTVGGATLEAANQTHPRVYILVPHILIVHKLSPERDVIYFSCVGRLESTGWDAETVGGATLPNPPSRLYLVYSSSYTYTVHKLSTRRNVCVCVCLLHIIQLTLHKLSPEHKNSTGAEGASAWPEDHIYIYICIFLYLSYHTTHITTAGRFVIL